MPAATLALLSTPCQLPPHVPVDHSTTICDVDPTEPSAPTGRKILTTCQDNRLRVWDYLYSTEQVRWPFFRTCWMSFPCPRPGSFRQWGRRSSCSTGHHPPVPQPTTPLSILQPADREIVHSQNFNRCVWVGWGAGGMCVCGRWGRPAPRNSRGGWPTWPCSKAACSPARQLVSLNRPYALHPPAQRYLTPFRAEWDPKDPAERLVVCGRWVLQGWAAGGCCRWVR